MHIDAFKVCARGDKMVRSKMQTAGTLRGIRTSFLLILLVLLIGYAHSTPLQYLPTIPGYIPVYIRYGDEPLGNINPELAEAFGETSNSAKSLQLDRTLDHVSNSFKENSIDALLEEPRVEHAYPLRVRATESRSFATANNGDENPNKPKLLTIYELPDDNETRPRRRYRGRSRTKDGNRRTQPAFKVGPLSNTEREELEELAFAVEKEETKPNELYVLNLKYSTELPDEAAHNRYKTHQFTAPIKLQHPLDEAPSGLSKISQIVNKFSKPLDDHNDTAPEANEEEPSVRIAEQQPAVTSLNKVLSVDLLDERKTTKDAASEIDKKESPIKEQRPAAILSNVDKILPINLLNENRTN